MSDAPADTSAVVLCDADPAWPAIYRRLARKLRAALAGQVLALHHAGSTSVPGLAAKPVIDMILEVADSADEAAYGETLAASGWRLMVREPDWFEHRCFRCDAPAANLHVFTRACPETRRMLAFRDHLRRHGADRSLYEGVKRSLAARDWANVQSYADAKTSVVAEIMERALEPDPFARDRRGR